MYGAVNESAVKISFYFSAFFIHYYPATTH